MSIYDDPLDYAKKTRIPVSLSRIWCAGQLESRKIMDAAKICPKCKQATLTIELGSYEEGYGDYVHCENDEIPCVDEDGQEFTTECDFTADPVKEFDPLNQWYDFDVIWAFSCGMMDRNREFGNLAEWIKFVRKQVDEVRVKLSA